MSYLYILSGVITIISVILCVGLAITRGKYLVDVGEYTPTLLWLSSLFIVGMGVALICNVPRDVVGLVNNGFTEYESIIMVILYNGIPTWSLYILVGYYFITHKDSKLGDISIILSTIIGISISLYYASLTLGKYIGSGDLITIGVLVAILLISMVVATSDLITKYVTKITVLLFTILYIVILFTDSIKISSSSVNIGKLVDYYITSEESSVWWMWWISWSPIVGKWLSMISKGKSVRQYILLGILVPSIISVLWVPVVYIKSGYFTNIDIIGKVFVFIIASLFMIGTIISNIKIINRVTKYPKIYYLLLLIVTILYIKGVIVSSNTTIIITSLVFIPLIIMSVVNIFKYNKYLCRYDK